MFTRETAGITRANLSVDPLATEGECSPGDDSYNPFDDPDVSEDTLRELDLTGYSPAEDVGEMDLEPRLPDLF